MKLPIRSTFSEKEWVKITPELRQFLNHRGERYLDFSVVEWADPIPVLSLCLMLRKDYIFNQHIDSFKKVKLVIDLSTRLDGHKRLLLFFSNQGFLAELLKYVGLVSVTGDPITLAEAEDAISNFNVALRYKNTNCIKIKVKNLEEVSLGEGLDSFIDDLICEALEEVSVTVEPSWSQYKDHAIQKLRHFCSELIENVIEHAYSSPNNSKEAFAVYARIRSGKNFVVRNDWSRKQNDDWYEQLNNERNNCFLLEKWDEYSANYGSKWIEVFIVDIGEGFLSQISAWKSDDQEATELLKKTLSESSRRPLRKIWHKVFIAGFSRLRREYDKTKMTGLELIHEILSQKEQEQQEGAPGEFFRLLTGEEVVGGHLPFGKAQGRGGHYQCVVPHSNNNQGRIENFNETNAAHVPGTAFHTCIEISGSAIVHPKAYIQATNSQISSIISGLDRKISTKKLNIYAVDQRYLREKGEKYDVHRRPTDVLNHEFTRQKHTDGSSKYSENDLYNRFENDGDKHLIWLPSDSVTKSDIKAWIDFCLFSPLYSLIVADIPLHRARIFEHVTSSEVFYAGRRSTNSTLNIYLITRGWFIASYSSEIRSFGASSKNYYFAGNSSSNLSKLSLDSLNQMLRNNDSNIFWGNVAKKSSRSFIAEPIEWESKYKAANYSSVTIEIKGYLDFNEAIAEPVNYKIIRAALERVIALWSKDGLMVISIDDMVRAFSSGVITIQNFNDISYDDLHAAREVLLLGSTYVTGDTGRRMRNLIEGNFPEKHISELYIFSHPSSVTSSGIVNRILNWDDDIHIKNVKNYGRYVRLEGTPYIKRGGVKSFGIERDDLNPYNMYREFAQGHLKLGHWEYSKSHDLLTPNLSRIIATNPAIVKWFCDELMELNCANKVNGKQYKNYLIYISHKVTRKLIDRIIKFKPQLQRLYEIHPLHKLNLASAQHVFFSPTTLEKIEATASKNTPLNIVLIDDAAVSGTTLRNAESSLIFNKEDRILTLFLIDRCGFSAEDNFKKYSEQITRKTYWAWDVPPLGASGHCRLCHSIDRIKALVRTIPNKSIQLKAKNWTDTWKSRQVVDEGWNLSGVRAQILNPPHTMSFGRPSRDITHINSTTLSSMSIEISNSSFQPSSPLNKFYRYSDKNSSRSPKVSLEILTTQVLLLGSGLTMPSKLDYYSAIVKLLWECNNADEYTALAGLTLASVENSLKEGLNSSVFLS